MARATGSAGWRRGSMVSSRYSAMALDLNSDTLSSMRSTGTFLCGDMARNQSGGLSGSMWRNSNSMFFSRSTIAARCTQGQVLKLTSMYFAIASSVQFRGCRQACTAGTPRSRRGRIEAGRPREQAMPGEELDHEAIEQPGLLDLAGMAGARQHLELAAGNERLQREGALMGAVLATGQDHRRTEDAREMAFRLGLLQRLELTEDGVQIGGVVALDEQIREEMRQRRRTKTRAQILEGVGPAIADAVLRIGLDPPPGEVLARIVAGAGQHQRRRLVRPMVIHEGQ